MFAPAQHSTHQMKPKESVFQNKFFIVEYRHEKSVF